MSNLTLVTGATGFIGSHLTRLLLEKGEKIRIFLRNPVKLKVFGLHEKDNLEVFKGDLLKPEDIPAALDGVDRLYHTAGFISTYPKDKKKVQRLNVDITTNLFETCGKIELKKIVYLASIFALGGGNREPVDEDTSYNLDGLNITYARAKRSSELYIRDKIREGLPIVRIYPCYCYGPGDLNNSNTRLLLTYLDRKLPGYIHGGQNVMDVRDAARGLYLGMTKGKIGEKYIVGGMNLSYDDIFSLLEGITGYPKPRIRMSKRTGKFMGYLNQMVSLSPIIDKDAAELMGHFWYYDDTKARKELGYSSRPVADTLREAVQWFCSRGIAPWPPGMDKSRS
ncbi:MAG: NAD-dependent epimerase/dehydratase family protein [Candidatus Aminicenantes bacterium]|nr:NAD-dependent epimerase/dehydratase family protein [Candidatus Aminicenantes bacterium]